MSAARLPTIEVRPLAAALVRDYLAGEPRLAPFFSGHPFAPAAYVRKAAEVDARLSPAQRQRVAGAFRTLSGAAADKLERVLAGDGYFVTTGQQAGLFTGPLYTIYKALSAIRLAAALEPITGRPVLALFWCASDDHDWDEVNHVQAHDAAQYVERVAVQTDAETSPYSMSHRPLPESVLLALDRFRDLLPDTPHRAELMQGLRAAYAPGRSVAAAFADALAHVLEGQAIALVDSAHPLVKLHSRPVIARALSRRREDERAVAAQTSALEAAGYGAQVVVAPGASNVFAQDASGRDRLLREADGWLLRRSRRRLSDGELSAWLERDPAAFSPNVLLRPVVESALFPTLAYVGGPAETSYLAQIGCLFEEHGIMPPVAFPRHSVTLIEERVQKALDAFGLDPAAVRVPFEELVARVLKGEMPEAVTAALGALRAELAGGYAALADAAAEVDPTLRGPVGSARNEALRRTAELEKKITRHLRQRQAEQLERLRRAAAQIQPQDSPQERVLNIYPYLARHGRGLLGAILGALPVTIDRTADAYDGVRCTRALAPMSGGGIA